MGEVLRPRACAVREEMRQAIADAANVDLSETALFDLMAIHDRLKMAVANAKSFYLAGVDIQASSQPDDASRAIQALKEAIEVANSACACLLKSAELLQEHNALEGSEWSNVVDADEFQAEASPCLHMSHLQEIRRLLTK